MLQNHVHTKNKGRVEHIHVTRGHWHPFKLILSHLHAGHPIFHRFHKIAFKGTKSCHGSSASSSSMRPKGLWSTWVWRSSGLLDFIMTTFYRYTVTACYSCYHFRGGEALWSNHWICWVAWRHNPCTPMRISKRLKRRCFRALPMAKTATFCCVDNRLGIGGTPPVNGNLEGDRGSTILYRWDHWEWLSFSISIVSPSKSGMENHIKSSFVIFLHCSLDCSTLQNTKVIHKLNQLYNQFSEKYRKVAIS